jgi:hypothetical protein
LRSVSSLEICMNAKTVTFPQIFSIISHVYIPFEKQRSQIIRKTPLVSINEKFGLLRSLSSLSVDRTKLIHSKIPSRTSLIP